MEKPRQGAIEAQRTALLLKGVSFAGEERISGSFWIFKFSNTLRLRKAPPTAVRASPGGKKKKVKIAPFRFAALRNFFNSFTPPFLVPNYPACEKGRCKGGTKKPGSAVMK
jgi:hypothetical protein